MPSRRGKPDDDVAENAEPLAVVDLDDPEIGVRPEDRFAALPPGPRLVPRRVHDESTRAPVVLLAGLVALFLLGSGLGGMDSDDETVGEPRLAPVLDRITGATLLLIGEDVAAIEVGSGAARQIDDGASHAFRLRAQAAPRSRILPSATPGEAWIVAPASDRTETAEAIRLADGTRLDEIEVEGTVVGAAQDALVVERPSGAIDAIALDGTTARPVAPAGPVLGAAAMRVATRPPDCSGSTCGVLVTELAAGATRMLSAELSAGGVEFGSMSPDGRLLTVARSDGVDTFGIVVDIESGATVPFRVRGVAREAVGPSALAWSGDGAWLFVATDRNGLDAVETASGTSYRVGGELPPFEAILTR